MKPSPLDSAHVVDDFYKGAGKLRKEFDAIYADPRNTDRRRFCWDPWSVPGQYSQLRTPSWEFFSEKEYSVFHEALLRFGQEYLGCHTISPPWLSLYLDGHFQEVHSDLPHGPWAFVYSLTDWDNRKFEGGQTFWFKDERERESGEWNEADSYLQTVDPKFNRLLVFDPSLPHGVKPIRGVARDPKEGRLVIHGWFSTPRPYFEGALTAKIMESFMAELAEKFGAIVAAEKIDLKWWITRIQIGKDGRMKGWKPLTVRPRGTVAELKRVSALFSQALSTFKLPARKAETTLTFPLEFGS